MFLKERSFPIAMKLIDVLKAQGVSAESSTCPLKTEKGVCKGKVVCVFMCVRVCVCVC